jgi:hypothetical protein
MAEAQAPVVIPAEDTTLTYLRVGDRVFLEWHRAVQDAFAPVGYISSGGLQDPRVRVEVLNKGVAIPPNLGACCFELQLRSARKAHKAFEKSLVENDLEVDTWRDELHDRQQAEGGASEADSVPGSPSTSAFGSPLQSPRLGKLGAGKSRASSVGSICNKRSAAELVAELSKLEQAVRNEEQVNEANYRRSLGHPVLYGQQVELMHRASGGFISLINARAKDEDKSIRVGVTPGGSSSRFLVEPGFKNVKAIGDKVYFDDVIALKSVKHEGMFLRICESPSHSIQRTREDYVTAAHEVNSGGKRALFAIRFCCRHDTKEGSRSGGDLETIHGDDIVMLYNPTMEAMLTVASRRQSDVVVSATLHAVVSATKAEHLCCFNPTPLKKLTSSEFIADTNSFWKVESVAVKGAQEPIAYTSKNYRLKHVATGAYLCIPKRMTPKGSANEALYSNNVKKSRFRPPGARAAAAREV